MAEKFTQNQKISVVGAGLAGSECALQLADMGYQVILFEMRDKNTAIVDLGIFQLTYKRVQ